MRNVAVILAGGKGSRTGSETPKQFLTVGGKTIIEYAISAFENHPLIDETAVVVSEEYRDLMAEILKKGGYKKVKRLLTGGEERYHSSLAAVKAYGDEDCNLLIHDGARPLVSARIISSCVEELQRSEAVETAVPATDTIIELSEDGTIARISPRRLLMNAQTPQCFRAKVIRKAFSIGLKDPAFNPTDDCSVVHKYMPEVRISVAEGDENNFKITYKTDIERFTKLITDK